MSTTPNYSTCLISSSPMVSLCVSTVCSLLLSHPELVIAKLGKKLSLRQRVIATATVFFRRFYLKSSYCETDPFMVITACCYVAAKAEESPVHIKNVVTEARLLFGSTSEAIPARASLKTLPQVKSTGGSSRFLPITPNSLRWSFISSTTSNVTSSCSIPTAPF